MSSALRLFSSTVFAAEDEEARRRRTIRDNMMVVDERRVYRMTRRCVAQKDFVPARQNNALQQNFRDAIVTS